MSAALEQRVLCIGPQTRAPRLSVLTPFHKHDPSALLQRMAPASRDIEFVLLDDGSASAELLSNVVKAAEALKTSVRIVIWARNRGRAAGRNRLIEEARGEYVLFLDADLIPDQSDFLHRWLTTIRNERPLVAFGGLSLEQAEETPDTALHFNLFGRSDCAPARLRARAAAQSTAASNLLARRDFLLATPFDDGFTGWGFEDTDWALTAARHTLIQHIDNPVTHAGLDTIPTLMRKSAEAGPNFARLVAKHPKAVRRFAAYRAARTVRPVRGLRSAFAWFARDPLRATPMPVRRAAFKLYRASHFAEHLV
jgi:glycosyltransferase involved in cell wall biosynthesis